MGPGHAAGIGWGITLARRCAITYAGIAGAAQVLGAVAAGASGGVSRSTLTDLFSAPGAFVLLHRAGGPGRDRRLRDPAAAAHQARGRDRPLDGHDRRGVAQADTAGRTRMPPPPRPWRRRTARRAKTDGKPVPVGPGPSPGQTGVWGDDDAHPGGRAERRARRPRRSRRAAGARCGRRADARAPPGAAIPTTCTDRGAIRRRPRIASSTSCRRSRLLDDIAVPTARGRRRDGPPPNEDDHRQEARELRHPGPRSSAGTRARSSPSTRSSPAPDVKLSRIEALSDDLAMALAARTLRIEAPIPGKSAVGIEIPNKDFNVVALRRHPRGGRLHSASSSTLTFALGRDVAGKAPGVDLAKMPHLLIAGATGSGKSVMVNALITSLLCEATPGRRPDDPDGPQARRAGGLQRRCPTCSSRSSPSPEQAKAALKWAVGEMEARYRRLAGATARNIRAFNETRVDPDDRMPYIVIIIDELADLMMREGKNVEDPIVRLAQKARADRHPHGPRDAAAVGQRRDGPDQGQLPEPDRVRDGVADRLAHDPRHARRGGPDRSRRHALPAVRPAAPDAPPGRLRVGRRDRPDRRSTGRTRPTTRTTTWRSSTPTTRERAPTEDLDRRGRGPTAA